MLFLQRTPAFESEIDLFEVMGISIDFEIDSEELEERYRRLSLELHPDFFETASEEEKRLSEKASVMLNTAYSTLREPTSGQDIYYFCLRKEKSERTYITRWVFEGNVFFAGIT